MDQQNPFEDILSKMNSQGPQPEAPAPEMMGDDGEVPENQLMRGKNPDPSQGLISALKTLQKYITETQDQEDIAITRSIISALTKLIDKNQQKLTQSLPQDQEMLPKHQMMARQAMGKKILQ